MFQYCLANAALAASGFGVFLDVPEREYLLGIPD